MPPAPKAALWALTSILALAAPVAGRAQAAPAPGCLALARGDGDSPVIAARVNGQGPFSFVLDTGSSGTTLDAARVARLGLAPDAEAERAEGLGGALEVRLYHVDRFNAGPVAIRGMTAPGIPAPAFASHDIAGLAGVDLFGARMAVWRWGQACVELAPSGGRPAGAGWRLTPSRWLQPWKILLPVRIGAVAGWGLLDTGAQKTVLSPGFARALGLSGATADAGDTLTGVDGRETALAAYDLDAVAVGAWRLGPTRARVADLPLFARLGGAEAPLAVIGMDWIGERPFAIDYGRRAVWQAPGPR